MLKAALVASALLVSLVAATTQASPAAHSGTGRSATGQGTTIWLPDSSNNSTHESFHHESGGTSNPGAGKWTLGRNTVLSSAGGSNPNWQQRHMHRHHHVFTSNSPDTYVSGSDTTADCQYLKARWLTNPRAGGYWHRMYLQCLYG